MPTVQVRVNTINTNVKQGKYDAIQITGFDRTNHRGFVKKFFSTKKGTSTATKAAEAAYGLNKDDWCEIIMDDSEFENVISIKKIADPDGGAAPPANAGGRRSAAGPGNPTGVGSSAKMTKAEWAEKDRKKEAAIARNSSLKAAVEFMKVIGKVAKKDNVDLVLDVARRFEDYLLIDNKQPGDEQGVAEPPAPSDANVHQEEDDDIPF